MQKFIGNALRERIVSVHYQPGESLYEKRLSEAFHISRTLIRAALVCLSAERLVTIASNLGSRLSEINLPDFQEFIE